MVSVPRPIGKYGLFLAAFTIGIGCGFFFASSSVLLYSRKDIKNLGAEMSGLGCLYDMSEFSFNAYMTDNPAVGTWALNEFLDYASDISAKKPSLENDAMRLSAHAHGRLYMIAKDLKDYEMMSDAYENALQAAEASGMRFIDDEESLQTFIKKLNENGVP